MGDHFANRTESRCHFLPRLHTKLKVVSGMQVSADPTPGPYQDRQNLYSQELFGGRLC